MKLEVWLKKNIEKLEAADIGTARLDCLVLLEDATGKERGWLLAHPEFELDEKMIKKLDRQIKKRVTHEPLAYLRGKTEFYGREFCIDYRVLEPRPESETMIELLKRSLKHDQDDIIIIDVGTGSGALAITAKLELPVARLIGTDIDPKCLIVARRNARLMKAEVEFLVGDLMDPFCDRELRTSNLIILANLPYVPDHFQINPAAMAEPRSAIFGGSDGLDLYRKFFKQIQKSDVRPLYIFTESMPPQHESLTEIALSADFKLQKTDDFIQVFSPI